jgi:formate dehydrogenase assembly factor FdhD
VEMVQKSAVIGAPVMVSVSAPTALAARMADAAGITLGPGSSSCIRPDERHKPT